MCRLLLAWRALNIFCARGSLAKVLHMSWSCQVETAERVSTRVCDNICVLHDIVEEENFEAGIKAWIGQA